ncbi:MAG: BatA and WFA domain-containing protein [Chloroflexi bacterium]|nr:BatA and WFA domain-containing protein [Chloroflexota bacterium]
MTFLAPLAFVALAIPVVIYAIHWLFGARKRLHVPALFLWADLPRVQTGRRKRHIPPFSLLLLLQLLAATAGVFALARPAVPAQPPRHVAMILDASASMQATDVAPSRFEAARAAALTQLNTLQATDEVSLIRAGKQAALLASGPPAAVHGALVAAQPGVTTPAIREALALASTRIAETPERKGDILVFTDGAWPAPETVGPLAAPVQVVPTGGGSNNQAVSVLVVRADPTGRGQTAFVEITNEAETAVHIPLQLAADGAPLDQRFVDIAPRSRAQLTIPLPSDAHRVTASLLGRDDLSLDDRLEVLAPGGPPRNVDLLGRASDGLRRAIESVPSLRVRTSDSAPPADLTVLAGVLPGQLPRGPLLLVDPPANSARLLGVGLGSGARVEAADPLLQGLDLVSLQSATPSVSGVPGWAHVILGNQQGPLVMDGRLEGHPVVSLTFNPAVSGLEKSLAFPLLISNATSFLLAQTESATNVPPSELFDRTESDIRPRPLPTFDTSAVPDPQHGTAEAWPWLAAAAVVLLGAEWFVFARRG